MVFRKIISILVILIGVFVTVTYQAWGFRLIALIGPERALGASNVWHEPDGSVLMTNPGAMLFWCLPFLALGIFLVVVAAKILRRSRCHVSKRRCGQHSEDVDAGVGR